MSDMYGRRMAYRNAARAATLQVEAQRREEQESERNKTKADIEKTAAAITGETTVDELLSYCDTSEDLVALIGIYKKNKLENAGKL